MRNNVIKTAKQFIARYGEQAYSKAREAERAARKRGKASLLPSTQKLRSASRKSTCRGTLKGARSDHLLSRESKPRCNPHSPTYMRIPGGSW